MNFQDESMGDKEYQQVLEQLPIEKQLPEFPGRPQRDLIINDEDILNLRIALNTAKDLNSFLKMV